MSLRINQLQTIGACKNSQESRCLPAEGQIDKFLVSLVQSRLGYENSVFAGLPTYLVRLIQSVQNAAAQLICNLQRSDHLSDVLAAQSGVPRFQDGHSDIQSFPWTHQLRTKCYSHALFLLEPIINSKQNINVSSISKVGKLCALLVVSVLWCHLSSWRQSAVELARWTNHKSGTVCQRILQRCHHCRLSVINVLLTFPDGFSAPY